MKVPLAIAFLAMSAGVLWANTLGGALSGHVMRVLFCALCVLGLATRSICETILLAIVVRLALMVMSKPNSLDKLFAALDLAAYFAAFITLLPR